MNFPSNSFKDILSGPTAFYNKEDYQETTKADLANTELLPTTFKYETENKVIKVAKNIFSTIFFPIVIYKWLHIFGGLLILPASNLASMKLTKEIINQERSGTPLNDEWKYKRITLEVNGYKIDTVIMGKPSTLGNGRWVATTNGNAEFYENKMRCENFKHILTELNGNAIVFNYPGVAISSGNANKKAMASAYSAILAFLEDKNGIDAKEIIGYGHSIGGGVQGDALKFHKLKKDKKYVFIKSRTFDDLSREVYHLLGSPFLGFLVKVLNWNISSYTKNLKAPEIILQTANVKNYEILTPKDAWRIKNDGIIPAEASHAAAILSKKRLNKHKKLVIGIPEMHNEPLKNPQFLAKQIEKLLVA